MELTPLEALNDAKAEALGVLATTFALIAEAQQVANDLVIEARGLGASWREIGEVAGVTPQAAQQRWRPS